ncbi:MAG TPA: flagellar biosynthetic protein FliO [Caulobacteraceae bacterium]|jgi:flagellar protein FliO/FliZ
MDFLDFLRAALALVVTLGLIGVASVGVKRFAPGLLGRLQTRGGAKKRMQIVETLVLGPTQRMVLVRVDDAERVILLGEGRELPATETSRTPR